MVAVDNGQFGFLKLDLVAITREPRGPTEGMMFVLRFARAWSSRTTWRTG